MSNELFGPYFLIGLGMLHNVDELNKKHSLLPMELRRLIIAECLETCRTLEKNRIINILNISDKYSRFQKILTDGKSTELNTHNKPKYDFAITITKKLLTKKND